MTLHKQHLEFFILRSRRRLLTECLQGSDCSPSVYRGQIAHRMSTGVRLRSANTGQDEN